MAAQDNQQPVYPTSTKPMFQRIGILVIGLAVLALVSFLFGKSYEDDSDIEPVVQGQSFPGSRQSNHNW